MIDFPETLTVNITENHIQHGAKRLCKLCPIALALHEMYPEFEVHVQHVYTAIFNFKQHKLYETPLSASDFMEAFDLGCQVKPKTFTFELWK